MEQALCAVTPPVRGQRDPFFPNQGESPNEAVMVCFECPVRLACDQHRKETGSEYGVWGGKHYTPRSK